MADVAVAGAGEVTFLSVNTPATTPAGQLVAVTETAVLTPVAPVGDPTNTRGRSFHSRYMLVRIVENGSQVDTVLTVKAGPTGQTPANLAALGDLVLPALTNNQDQVVQLDLSRFGQANGTVRIEVAGTAGGSAQISVIHLSKNVL